MYLMKITQTMTVSNLILILFIRYQSVQPNTNSYVMYSCIDPLGQLYVDLTRFENNVAGLIDKPLQEIKKGSLQLAITVDILDH